MTAVPPPMRRSGFTLLEVLVAVTVGGFALSIVTGAVGTLLELRERHSRLAERAARVLALRQQLSDWIAAAVLAQGDSDTFLGTTRNGQDGAADELALLTASPTPAGSSVSRMRLRVVAYAELPVAGLVAEFETPGELRTERVSLDSAARTLRLQYLAGQDSIGRWTPGWISSSVLPKAVLLTITTSEVGLAGDILRRPLLVPIRGAR